jgi:hypothetical protein
MRRTISVFWIIVGVAAGLAGGLFYAWRVNPLVLTDTRPMQLSRTGQVNYLVALSLAYAQDKDLFRAVERLNEHLGKDWQELADTACELAQTGFASTNTGLTGGNTGCNRMCIRFCVLCQPDSECCARNSNSHGDIHPAAV